MMPNNMLMAFQSFMQNPTQFFSQRNVNIPQDISKNPDKIIQHMMNNGMISQEQYNHAKQMAEQMKNNPMFRGMFK